MASPLGMLTSPSTQVQAVETSHWPVLTLSLILAKRSGAVSCIVKYVCGWLWENLNAGYSSISLTIVPNVFLHTSTVSGQSQSQFMSMCAWPTRSMVTGWEACSAANAGRHSAAIAQQMARMRFIFDSYGPQGAGQLRITNYEIRDTSYGLRPQPSPLPHERGKGRLPHPNPPLRGEGVGCALDQQKDPTPTLPAAGRGSLRARPIL